MKCILLGVVENVETFEGKSGWGATITLSSIQNKKRTFLSFNTRERDIADKFESKLQEDVEVMINLEQNNFGLRLGDVISVDSEDLSIKPSSVKSKPDKAF
jgi:urease accessory protein UreE